jgi:hypothetical protein
VVIGLGRSFEFFTTFELLKVLILSLQDCDFPEDVRVPEIRPESHPEEINVMEFLNIKRAKSVMGKEEKSKE